MKLGTTRIIIAITLLLLVIVVSSVVLFSSSTTSPDIESDNEKEVSKWRTESPPDGQRRYIATPRPGAPRKQKKSDVITSSSSSSKPPVITTKAATAKAPSPSSFLAVSNSKTERYVDDIYVNISEYFPHHRERNNHHYSEQQTAMDKLLSSPEFKEANEKLKDFCAHPKNCYSAKCYAPLDYVGGGCFPSPYHSDIVDAVRKRLELTKDVPFPEEYKTLRTHSGGYKYREMTCPDKQDQREEYFVTNEEKNKKEDPLFAFKKHTNFLFNKWYDWKGKCTAKPTRKIVATNNEASSSSSNNNNNNEDFATSGDHSKKDGLYHVKNVCFRPEGGMLGYLPKNKAGPHLKEYKGTDDVFFAVHMHEGAVKDFLTDKNVEPLAEPADCYLDTTVILMPLQDRMQNGGHAFHRFASLLRVKNLVLKNKRNSNETKKKNNRKKKSSSATSSDKKSEKKKTTTDDKNTHDDDNDDVTIAYPILYPPLAETKEQMMNELTFHLYYDAINTSWFSFHAYNWTHLAFENYHLRKQREKEIHEFVPSDNDLRNLKVCFKEVIVWQDAYVNDTSSSRFGMIKEHHDDKPTWNIPGRDTSFVIHGPRNNHSRETLRLVDSQLNKCARLPPRRKRIRPMGKPLRIIIMTRSVFRRMSMQPWIASYFAERVPVLFGPMATVELLEHTKVNFRDVVERCGDADVIIGVYGAALVWSAFLPPGAILIELNHVRYGYGHTSGINLHANGEYEGAARMQQQLHVKITEKVITQRYPVVYVSTDALGVNGAVDVMSGPGGHYFDETVMRPILCLMKHTQYGKILSNNSLDEMMVPEQCKGIVTDEMVSRSGRRQTDDPVIRAWNVARAASSRLFPKQTKNLHRHRQSHRLELMVRYKRRVGDALAPFIFRIPNPSQNIHWIQNGEIKTEILLIEPCAARAFVWPEFSALRQIIQRFDTIWIAEYSMGRETCATFEALRASKKNDKHNFIGALSEFVLPVKGKTAKESGWKENIYRNYFVEGPREFKFCDYHVDCLTKDQKYFEVILHDQLSFSSALSQNNNNDEIFSLMMFESKFPTAEALAEKFRMNSPEAKIGGTVLSFKSELVLNQDDKKYRLDHVEVVPTIVKK